MVVVFDVALLAADLRASIVWCSGLKGDGDVDGNVDGDGGKSWAEMEALSSSRESTRDCNAVLGL